MNQFNFMVVNYKTVPLTRNNKLVFLSPNEKNGFHAYQNYFGVFGRAQGTGAILKYLGIESAVQQSGRRSLSVKNIG